MDMHKIRSRNGRGFFLALIALFFSTENAQANSDKVPPFTPTNGDSHGDSKTTGPFKKFVGEWTLKDEAWTQNWGKGVEHIKIPHHHTICTTINTDNSLLSVVDATSPKGNIYWTYNAAKKEVRHLSSFEPSRTGVGNGTVNDNGDVTLKISFQGESEGTHRIYTYKWVSDDEYEMLSRQYDDKDQPTGLFYGGTFTRIHL